MELADESHESTPGHLLVVVDWDYCGVRWFRLCAVGGDSLTLYYQDKSATLHHGDSLEILPMMPDQADVLLTDPPYFKVKQDEWDNQWDKAGEFLGWMGEWLDHTKPLLAPHASVWVFASPAMTSSVERLVGERFRVLNSVRWIKPNGWHERNHLPSLRRFLTPWEGIVFAEQSGEESPDRERAIRRATFGKLGQYIQKERERAGWERDALEVALGFTRKANPQRGTELCRRWEEGSSLPSADTYQRVRSLVNAGGGDFFGKNHGDLLRWRKELSVEFDDLRRHFEVTDRVLASDTWTFSGVRPYAGKHPCEKPQDMLTHMIETSSRPGWTILDPFAGSGSTLLAARNAGRKAIGIEKDEAWCEKIALRLSENTLNLGEAA